MITKEMILRILSNHHDLAMHNNLENAVDEIWEEVGPIIEENKFLRLRGNEQNNWIHSLQDENKRLIEFMSSVTQSALSLRR